MKPYVCKYLSALITGLALVGCGGSNSVGASNTTGTLNFSGATTVATTSTSDATVPGTGGTTVSTGDASTGGTAVIPSGAVAAGTTVPAGTNFAILPAGVGFPGAFPNNNGLAVNTVSPSGVGVSEGGFTQVNTALPLTTDSGGSSYTLAFPAGSLKTTPSVRGAVNPFTLTIGSEVLTGRYYVIIVNGKPQVISPVPTSISGNIPNNGENAAGAKVLAVFGPGNNGRTALLTINYGGGFQLQQQKVITKNAAQFSDLIRDTTSVSNKGVAVVSFSIGDLP